MEIHEDVAKESFEEFKNSISYGKRNDLNFKFLSHMNDRSAADFFQGLLAKTGASLNDGSFSRVIEHLAVKAFQDVLQSMSLPRVLLTRHPMGRPIGFPGNRDQHIRVITSALEMLTQKEEAPSILHSEEPFLTGLS